MEVGGGLITGFGAIARDEPPVERWKRGKGEWLEGTEQQGKRVREERKVKMELAGCCPYSRSAPVDDQRTHTAGHHDVHSPPLMSPSHS